MIDKFSNEEILSYEIKDLITGMLRVDPERRYTLELIAKHPWVTNPIVMTSTEF